MRFRTAALIAPLLLVVAACGARLTDAERLAGIRSLGRGGGAIGPAGPGATVGPGATTGPGATVGPGATTGPGATSGPGAVIPPGGNGGATDTGVTANSITLTVASDIS